MYVVSYLLMFQNTKHCCDFRVLKEKLQEILCVRSLLLNVHNFFWTKASRFEVKSNSNNNNN